MATMSDVTSLQIRNVPDDVHAQLKARAAAAGQSLSEFALAELRRSLERPTTAEWLDRLAGRRRVHLDRSGEELIREARDERS